MAEKSPLEKAASSLDAVVRNAAIRRMEIDKEVVKLDGFLDFYSEAQQSPPIAPGSIKEPAKSKTPTKLGNEVYGIGLGTPFVVSKPTKVRKGERLAAAATNILETRGQPMQLQELYAALKAGHPDVCPAKVDSLRPRLHEQSEKIVMIRGRGYWLAGVNEPR